MNDSLSEKTNPVLEIQGLKTHFFTEEGRIPAVDGVDLEIYPERIMAVVGESGCGKSVMSYSILRLIQSPGKIVGGKLLFRESPDSDPLDIAALDEHSDTLFHLRGGAISMIFQEPMSALSPVHSVGNQMCEAILLHQDISPSAARAKAVEMLGKVGIPNPEKCIDQLPFELSGGMRQRVVIAMALVCQPRLLIADEPTTALDVTIQAQVLQLIKDLQQESGASVLFITHDLGVVAQIADDVSVMYLGRVVERGSVRQVLKNPLHPYTAALLKSVPRVSSRGSRLPAIDGSVPSLTEIPAGCPFHPRCPHAVPGRCDAGHPPPLENFDGDRRAACIRVDEIRSELAL